MVHCQIYNSYTLFMFFMISHGVVTVWHRIVHMCAHPHVHTWLCVALLVSTMIVTSLWFWKWMPHIQTRTAQERVVDWDVVLLLCWKFKIGNYSNQYHTITHSVQWICSSISCVNSLPVVLLLFTNEGLLKCLVVKSCTVSTGEEYEWLLAPHLSTAWLPK